MTKKINKQQILTLERYLPYRLSILSNKVSGIIAQTYKGKFALSITEWRIMAVLGEYPEASADEVSARTQIEKSILSRAISKLLSRKLITRSFDKDDKRRSILMLTKTGLSVYDEMVPISYKYEQDLLTCFNKQEREVFSQLIDRLYSHAGELEE
ncbi:MarR family winged helix-turn-helix transcriptional regulator [Oceanicoccus sagamiensis]|uniref:MarR family transcriptional regulator n=1 Tax=Oceanicoccus sagamiensis TaxID=716816 RepID=A0A1X9NK64_9GAMM|nr:MarR family winged helix-turn-helix transcriptional regulator [Oceanicoccus sagamiensis]ARN75247.1 MarR family transcriptional regulator [Oceanicoccus sagamiensis]